MDWPEASDSSEEMLIDSAIERGIAWAAQAKFARELRAAENTLRLLL